MKKWKQNNLYNRIQEFIVEDTYLTKYESTEKTQHHVCFDILQQNVGCEINI